MCSLILTAQVQSKMISVGTQTEAEVNPRTSTSLKDTSDMDDPYTPRLHILASMCNSMCGSDLWSVSGVTETSLKKTNSLVTEL